MSFSIYLLASKGSFEINSHKRTRKKKQQHCTEEWNRQSLREKKFITLRCVFAVFKSVYVRNSQMRRRKKNEAVPTLAYTLTLRCCCSRRRAMGGWKKCVILRRQQEIKTLCEWTKANIFASVSKPYADMLQRPIANVFNGVLMWKYCFSKRNEEKKESVFFCFIPSFFVSSRFIMLFSRDFSFIHTKYLCHPSCFFSPLFCPK